MTRVIASVLKRAEGEAVQRYAIDGAIRDRRAEVAMLKYVEVIGSAYHDPSRREAQTETARGGPPSVLRAKALVFCALEDWRGMV